MEHLNVAVIGDLELAGKLGKKSAEGDLTLAHSKEGDTVFSYIETSLYPQKLVPLLFALRMADCVVLCVNQVDKFFGESVIAADLLQMKGVIALGETVGEGDVRGLVKGTALENWPVVVKGAEEVKAAVKGIAVQRPAGATSVLVDHSFAVKSVGAVSLGIVQRGILKKHQKLQVYPTEKMIEAKSLQVQDEDVEEVVTGSRVGVAVKGAEVEELERGRILAEPGTRKVGQKLKVKVKEAVIAKGQVAGSGLFANSGLMMVQAKLEGEELELVSPISYEIGEKLLLVKPDAKLRVVGSAEIV